MYADGQPVRHTVRYVGTTIACHALDLTRAPADLLSAVAALAADIASSS